MDGLRNALERIRSDCLKSRRPEVDPIAIVRGFSDPSDIEVVGLLAAILAYGRVDKLCAHIREVLLQIGPHPAEVIRRGVPDLSPMTYRFHKTADLTALLKGIHGLLGRHKTMSGAFLRHCAGASDLRRTLIGFVRELSELSGEGGRGLRFLLADPSLGGACKRWHLFLRWMVRKAEGDTDFGIWSDVYPASRLIIPLDTHIVRISRRLGFTKRKTVDWAMAEEVTSALRAVNPHDPLRYDFALCHLGMAGLCPAVEDLAFCASCPLQDFCLIWQKERARGGRALSHESQRTTQ